MSFSRFSSLPILLRTRKLRVVPMQQDGNCFYRAVATAYHEDEALHHQLRRSLMDYIMAEKKRYEPLFFGQRSMSGMIMANRRAGVWNTDLADIVPAAIAAFLNVRVEVYSVCDDDSVVRYVFGESGGHKIRLLHRWNHYDVLMR